MKIMIALVLLLLLSTSAFALIMDQQCVADCSANGYSRGYCVSQCTTPTYQEQEAAAGRKVVN